MEKYFYLKNPITNEIKVLDSQEFDYFGGIFKDHILYDFYEDKYLKMGLELPYPKRKIAFFLNFVENWNKYKGIWDDSQAVSYTDLTKEEKSYVDNKIIEKELQYEKDYKNLKKIKNESLKEKKKQKSVGNRRR